MPNGVGSIENIVSYMVSFCEHERSMKHDRIQASKAQSVMYMYSETELAGRTQFDLIRYGVVIQGRNTQYNLRLEKQNTDAQKLF